MDSEKQRAAQEAVLWGLLAVDKRQGYRGPLQQLATKAEQDKFIEKSKKVMGDQEIVPGRYYVGLVTQIAKDSLSADITIGGKIVKLPALGMRWAREVNGERYYPSVLINNVKPLKVGDVLVVRAVKDKKGLTDDKEAWSDSLAGELPEGFPLVRLEQEPEPQAAIVSIDPHRQYLSAMVGGYDFDANEFNRVFQACRQPGSSFKPIVYAGAIEKMGWTEGTVLVDSPIVYDDPENQNRWKPANYDEGFKGEVLLKEALVNSMNIPAVKTFIDLARYLGYKNEVIGIKAINDFAHGLGFSTPQPRLLGRPGQLVRVPHRARAGVRDHQPARREEADVLHSEDRRPLRPHGRRPHRIRRPVGLAARPHGQRLRPAVRAR
jgi:penicillin-binding protein 1A